MPGRFPALTLLAGLLLVGNARAHRLEGEYRVLPGGKVQIESWYDLTGDSARGAEVRVLRADGQLLTEGRTNDEGLFVFAFARAEPLQVVISAGAGHRKELAIPAAELAGSAAAPEAASSAPAERADRSSRVEVKDVLTGVALLLAVAAFALSLRNARQLREWKRQTKSKGSEGTK
jgi:nickel transport protein